MLRQYGREGCEPEIWGSLGGLGTGRRKLEFAKTKIQEVLEDWGALAMRVSRTG